MATMSSCFSAASPRMNAINTYIHHASLCSKPPQSPLQHRSQFLGTRVSPTSLRPKTLKNDAVKLTNGAALGLPLICRADLRSSITEFKPGSRVETDKLPSAVRDRTIKAVDTLGGRVTIGDVAGKAGLKLNEAEKALQALAADAGGFLEVSDEGDVLYVFPRDYRAKLAAKSFRMRFEPVLEKSKAVAEYLIRVSFGTALLASIVIVYTAIIAILSGKSEEDNRGRRGRSYDPGLGRSFDPGFNIFISPSDLFWYWDPYYYRRRRRKTEGGMNFFESVFSFVFGDGDPNQEIEEERWKLIGEYITSHGGVVTAEELAPYLDVPPIDGNKEDESYVLPVLLRFDGRPEVNSEGNILYRFPSLQRTASTWFGNRKEYVGKKWKTWVGEATQFLQEKQWDFSKAGGKEKSLVIALGGLNLAGVILLGSMLKDIATIRGGFLSFVTDVFPLLQIYAASFFAIPLSRWFLIRKKNVEIDERNRARKQRALALEMPDPTVRQKIESARAMAERTVIGADRIIYSSEKDFAEQDYDAKEWERQYRELERSD